jgi:membrane-associated protease RseP (regulator of RpoE activity)
MSALRTLPLALITLVALSAAAYGQQQQPSSGPSPSGPGAAPSSTTTTTTSVSRPAPSPSLNTDTNAQPDMTGTNSHPDTDVRIRPGVGKLASGMANFSVRTGLEVNANQNAQVVVRKVRPDSPAARGGVEQGDIITKIDGAEVSTLGDFQKLVTQHPAKPAFMLTLRRGDHSFRAPLGRQLTLMGMTLFPDPTDRPTVVVVDPKSPAGYAGFRMGDMITGFDHQVSPTMTALLDLGIPFIRGMSEGQGIPFQVVRDGKPLTLSVTRPADAELPLLTPDQERHLRHLAMGDEIRPAERPRTIKTRTTTTHTTGGQQINAMNNPQQPTNPYGMNGMAGGGFGLALPGGGIGGVGTGTGLNGSNQNVNSASAVLFSMSNTTTPTPQTGAATTGTMTNAGQSSGQNGTVGFVQIQANIGLNGNPNTNGGIPPGANPITGNTATAQNVTPGGNNVPNTSVSNPPVSLGNTMPPTANPSTVNQQAQQAQAANGNLGVNANNNPNNANNNGTGTPTQSYVSASVSGVPAGTYTLVVNQYGSCGSRTSFAPGPAALTLGTINATNGTGSLQNVTVNFGPQAFVGRAVSLVPASGQTGANAGGNVIACGVFRGSNSNQPFIGGNNGAFGNGIGTGTTTGTGTVTTGNGPTGTGTTGTGPTTGTGTTGTGTGNTAPGSITPPGGLPRPLYP